MSYRQFDIWTANLDPQFGTEAGKVRPVLIIQSNLLNNAHPSTIVCPITSKVRKGISILRVDVLARQSGLKKDSAIMIDQVRAIDNRRLIKKVGTLARAAQEKVIDNLRIVMDLEME